MEWSTLYETILSSRNINDKFCVKIAKVIQGIGFNTRDSIKHSYRINRLEIKVSFNSNVPIGITFSHSEFEWLINFLKSDNDYCVFDGKKIFVGHKIGHLYSIIAIENERSFGVLLNGEDRDNLFK